MKSNVFFFIAPGFQGFFYLPMICGEIIDQFIGQIIKNFNFNFRYAKKMPEMVVDDIKNFLLN